MAVRELQINDVLQSAIREMEVNDQLIMRNTSRSRFNTARHHCAMDYTKTFHVRFRPKSGDLTMTITRLA